MSDPIKIGAEAKVEIFYDADRRKFTATILDEKYGRHRELASATEATLRKEIRKAVVPEEAQFAYYIEKWFSKYNPPDFGKVRIVCRRGSKYEVEYTDKKGERRFTVDANELYKLESINEKKLASACDTLSKAIKAWDDIDTGLIQWTQE